ncbi:mucoidy inhibitor MuiA family protein [Lewinella sp. LCG006]|uniref:mucoidy inhibitor MuiA family protein n=1 Tax=Lewinella sp. LCG006 TaxID=3231911 RepID=UPI00345FD8D7
MNKLLLGLFLSCCSFLSLNAQTEISTTIRDVTVYLQTAQVTRTGKANLPAGRGTIVLTGLSPQLDQSSVRLGATGDFVILSVNPRNNFLASPTESPEYTRLTKERERLADLLAREQIKLDALAEEEKILLANKSIGGTQTGVDVDALLKVSQYLRQRLAEIRTERLDIGTNMRADQEKLAQVDQQLNELRKTQQKSFTEVVVQYQTERAVNAEFQLMYLINGASWSATYDLRVEDLEQAVDLSYGALVTQNTGEDWNNVKLTLSTGNPRQQQNAPRITTWYLNPNQPYARAQESAGYGYDELMQTSNVVISRSDVEAADFAGADVAVNLTNTEFRVRLEQDILSNGQQYRVLVDDYQLPADFQYYAAPKYDCHVYLTARVTDWRKYSLLSGPVNLFFDGAYVGKSQLSTGIATDTLVFSLGRDEGITIEREREDKYRSRNFLGSKVEQRIGWTIKVQKSRRNDVPLIIEDQIPVSTTDEIEVELDQAKGATLDPTTGKLRWELKMKFGDQTEVGFRYLVKHPKSMNIFLE